MQKNAVEMVKTQKSLGFFNRIFLASKLNNWWRPILDLSIVNKFLKTGKLKMETPEIIRISPPDREIDNVHSLQGHIFPHTNILTFQEVPRFSKSNVSANSSKHYHFCRSTNQSWNPNRAGIKTVFNFVGF